MSEQSALERPIFVVAPPGSGEVLLGQALLAAPGTWHAGEGPDALLQAIDPDSRIDESRGHRLTGSDADGAESKIRGALTERYDSLDVQGRPGDAVPRLFDATPRNALRVPLLNAIFPDALFVYLHRAPVHALTEAVKLWESEQAVTYPELEGWEGPPWSLLLVPRWTELNGLGLEEIVVEQWRRTATTLLDDLEALGPDRWCVVDHQKLLEQPEDEVQRVFRFLDVGWHSGCSQPARMAAAQLARSGPPSPSEELVKLLPRVEPLAKRASDWIAGDPSGEGAGGSRFGELKTTDDGLGQLLKRLRSSLLVSTYQTNRLIALRWGKGALNVHLRSFDRPMGLAAHGSGFAVGTRAEVHDFRDFPAVAQSLEPKGTHDACYMPRNAHYTADIAIHDLGFANNELWLVATRFSCLATLDMEHSFVPRWKPSFVSEIRPDDRCHLNGMAIVDGAPRYLTALGVSDEPGGWRADKASGGVLIDASNGRLVAEGLSMPHSPRWHDGELYVLESGKGTIARVDTAGGGVETIAELPGFTRGLSFSGNTAFVGLSQIRETATFGGLPIAELDERKCGIWAVDLDSGEVLGSLAFEDTIQEIFDLELLPGVRFPDIAEPSSPVAQSSWYLPSGLQ